MDCPPLSKPFLYPDATLCLPPPPCTLFPNPRGPYQDGDSALAIAQAKGFSSVVDAILNGTESALGATASVETDPHKGHKHDEL